MAKRLTQEDKNRIFNMHKSGYTLNEIGDMSGRSITTIKRVLAEFGYKYSIPKKSAKSSSMREDPGKNISIETIVKPAEQKVETIVKPAEQKVETIVKPDEQKTSTENYFCVTTGVSKTVVGYKTKFRYVAHEANGNRVISIENRTGKIVFNLDILKDLQDELSAVEKMALSIKAPKEIW